MPEEIVSFSLNFGSTVASWDTVKNDPNYYTTYEAATYYAAPSIVAAAGEAHVILVSYPYHNEKNFGQYIESFKAWLADEGYVSRYDSTDMSETDIFAAVKDEIIQLVDAGSKVVDVIGYGKDNQNNDYNFDFVNDIDALTLTVGGEELEKEDLSEDLFFTDPYETGRYGFGSMDNGSYKFIVHYYEKGENGKSGECFVWDINVPVTKDATVQLTYTVQLTDPQTTSGTYGVYDRDGDGKTDKGETIDYGGNVSLYTNKSAVLYPVDSKGVPGLPQAFAKPTVSYTVSGSSIDTSDPDDSDPDPDPGKPTPPGVVVPEEPVPTTPGVTPEEPGTSIPEENPPKAEAPETGDMSLLWLAMTALSGSGLAVVSLRKKRDDD